MSSSARTTETPIIFLALLAVLVAVSLALPLTAHAKDADAYFYSLQ